MDKGQVDNMEIAEDLQKAPNEMLVEEANTNPLFDKKSQKHLVRKQDMIIIPLLCMGYFFGYLDRGQIGNARLMGLEQAVNIDNHQFFESLMIFYVGFLVIELPAALLMRVVPAQFVFGGAVLSFGLFACLISTVKGFAGLMVLRLLLGFGEAILTLGFLYLSLWYTSDELAFRAGLIYCSTPVAGFASGLISYGVAKHMKFVHGLHSWQWLFIVEGIPTIALGMIIIFVLPSLPDRVANKGHWLFRDPKEHKMLMSRTVAARNTPDARIVPRQILIGLKDPKTWLCSLIVAAPALGITAFNVFLPTFVRAFGFDPLTAQLYTIIPYSFAIISTPLFCWLADRYRHRALPMFVCLVISIVGFVILLSTTSKVALIAGCCFVATRAYPAIAIGASWISQLHGGYTKRSTAFGVSQVFVQSYSIIGTQIYTKPPRFFMGHGVLLGMYVLALLSLAALWIWLKRQNRRRDAEAEERRNGTSPKLVNVGTFEDLCDYHPDWRYII